MRPRPIERPHCIGAEPLPERWPDRLKVDLGDRPERAGRKYAQLSIPVAERLVRVAVDEVGSVKGVLCDKRADDEEGVAPDANRVEVGLGEDVDPFGIDALLKGKSEGACIRSAR